MNDSAIFGLLAALLMVTGLALGLSAFWLIFPDSLDEREKNVQGGAVSVIAVIAVITGIVITGIVITAATNS